MQRWQTRSEGKEKWFRNPERSTGQSQVTGRKLGKTKMKNETAICRESHFRGVLHFHEQWLTRLHLKSREKAGSRCLDLLLLQFLFQMSTLTSARKAHPQRGKQLMLKMQHPCDPCWHGRICMFCFKSALAWSCGQDTSPMFSSTPEEHLQVLLHLKGIQLMFPKIPQQSEPQGTYSTSMLLN